MSWYQIFRSVQGLNVWKLDAPVQSVQKLSFQGPKIFEPIMLQSTFDDVTQTTTF